MEPTLLTELLPTVERMLTGNGMAWLDSEAGQTNASRLKSGQPTNSGPSIYAAVGSGSNSTHSTFRTSYFNDLDSLPEGSIAIVPMQGIITQYGYCGGGSMARAQFILEAGAHKNVAGLLIDTNSGGGQANGLNTVYDAIRTVIEEYGKPVVGLVNDGMAASAAYHTLSACNEIWATHSTCEIGSIGALMGLRDRSEADKKAGETTILVYATKSTRKNASVREALAGDTTALVAELDFRNEDFHARVLAHRTLTGPAAELDGEMFNALQAAEYGLINGICSYNAVLDRIVELAGDTPNNLDTPPAPLELPDFNFSNQPTPPISMKYAALCTLLGFPSLAVTEGHSSLNEASLQAIENALVERGTQATQLTALTGQLTTANTNLTTRTTELSTAQTTIADLEKKVLENPAGGTTRLKGQEIEPKPAGQLNATQQLNADMMQELATQRKQFGLDPE